MPRYLIVRTFDVAEEEMPEVGRRSRTVIDEKYPDITWEHSHVIVDKEGKVMTYCVYDAPDEAAVKAHAADLGDHRIEVLYEIAGDVSPADFPAAAAS
jgi:Fe2+ or Zn2+ uptake regulation protein